MRSNLDGTDTKYQTSDKILVAAGVDHRGASWALWWPFRRWAEMTAEEKETAVSRQADLLDASVIYRRM
jgi:hypothetical protein